jgi:hypothetical protein
MATKTSGDWTGSGEGNDEGNSGMKERKERMIEDMEEKTIRSKDGSDEEDFREHCVV